MNGISCPAINAIDQLKKAFIRAIESKKRKNPEEFTESLQKIRRHMLLKIDDLECSD